MLPALRWACSALTDAQLPLLLLQALLLTMAGLRPLHIAAGSGLHRQQAEKNTDVRQMMGAC
jgi:hypothetical protein